MKVIATIPIHGRQPLIKHTIERLLNKNGVDVVVCAGWTDDEQEVCEKAGAVFIKYPNDFLGAKWNACFQKARELGADAVLFMGSSDWVSDDWVKVMAPHLDTYDMVGKRGCYMLDIGDIGVKKYRLVYWPGYKDGSGSDEQAKRRANESIGIGRLISKAGLDRIDWKPFDDAANNSMDWTMFNRIENNTIIESDLIHSMSISCDRWKNKHKFEMHWGGVFPSKKILGKDMKEFLENNFPEYNAF